MRWEGVNCSLPLPCVWVFIGWSWPGAGAGLGPDVVDASVNVAGLVSGFGWLLGLGLVLVRVVEEMVINGGLERSVSFPWPSCSLPVSGLITFMFLLLLLFLEMLIMELEPGSEFEVMRLGRAMGRVVVPFDIVLPSFLLELGALRLLAKAKDNDEERLSG